MELDRFALLIGMPVDHAEAYLLLEGKTLRVTAQDGVFGVVTADFQPNRVNVAIANGKIVGISGLG